MTLLMGSVPDIALLPFGGGRRCLPDAEAIHGARWPGSMDRDV